MVLLPDLSRRLRAGDEAGGRESFNRGAEFALFLTLPAALALAVIAREDTMLWVTGPQMEASNGL